MHTNGVQVVSDREVVTTRFFPYPRERVFEAWTDPAQLARWWGPRGFTNTFAEFDPRPDGHWRFVMHGSDGSDFKNHSVFREVVRPSRIAFDHVTGPVYHATFDFEAVDGGTRILWHMRFDNAKFLAENQALIVSANGDNMDRLEAVLAEG